MDSKQVSVCGIGSARHSFGFLLWFLLCGRFRSCMRLILDVELLLFLSVSLNFIQDLQCLLAIAGRRVNEDNIDLNRNFLSDEEFAFVRSRDPNYAQYVDFNHVLNPTTKPFKNTMLNELYSLYTMVHGVATYGVTSLKRAMVSGEFVVVFYDVF